MASAFSFDETQFNRLFPFYLVINRELKVIAMGKSISKLFGVKKDTSFNDLFSIPRPYTPIIEFNDLVLLQNQLVVLEAMVPEKLSVRGQLEYLSATDTILFVGSPWFGSIEQLTEKELVFDDFAYHDPLIDLLHVLKSQEITNEELRQLLSTINKQKKDLQRVYKEVHDIALFPTQNPDPLIRINFNGEVLSNNPAAASLDFFEMDNTVYRNDEFFKQVSVRIDKSNLRWIIEAKSNNRDYSFVCVSMMDEGYVNIYGRDITLQKKDRESLKVLSQIAEDNINAVVIMDSEGRIIWVNKSFVEMTGYRLPEAIGKKQGNLLYGPETDKKTIDYLNRQIEAGERFNTEIIIYNKSGNKYWLRLQGQPIINESGEVTGFFALEEDITIEKESESRLRQALENIGDNVWEHDFRTGQTYFSKSENEFLGLETNETANAEDLWWKSVIDEDRHLLVENDKKYRNAEIDSHNMEYRIRHSNGSIKWVLDRGVVIEKDRNGNPMRITGTHTDITKIKQTEAELASRVTQFKTLSESIPAVIYEFVFKKDGSQHFRYVSPAVEKVFGISPEIFASKDYIHYLHPDDLEEIRKKNLHSRLTLEPFEYEVRLVIPNKGTFWTSISSSVTSVTEDGDAVFTGLMLNTTDRKKAESALRINEEKYRSIISNMHLGLLEVDLHDVITFANDSFCQICGYSQEEIMGKQAHKLFVRQESFNLVLEKNQLRKKGFSDAYEIAIHSKKGELKWLLISASPRYNDQGEHIGSLGIHLDITDQKTLEQALILAKDEAIQLANTKELFLANMSHEIRTPLNAVIGMVRELKLTSLNQTQKLLLIHADASSGHLLSLLNNILDLSKINSGNLNLDNTPFNLHALFNEVRSIIEQLAIEKLLSISFQLPNDKDCRFVGDPVRLRQVLINIIGNAIKFTDKGSIEVTCVNNEEINNFQTITITVTDTGIGMDAEFLNTIFDSFSQENRGIQNKFSGTGLGMTISKRIIELMNGQIEVSSEKGVGSKFTVRLTLEKDTINQSVENKEVNYFDVFKGKQILLVEDNEMNRFVARSMLTRYGIFITEAENGAIAVDMLSTSSFDLILMDMQMPLMDGIEATQLIRKQGISTPIIALTANAFKSEIDRCLAAGMNDYASKPYEEAVLLNKLIKAWSTKKVDPEVNQQDIYHQENFNKMIVENTATLETNHINLDYINKISPGNEVFRNELFVIFLNQSALFLEKARQHQIDKKYFELSTIAHQFKPHGAYLGVDSLSKLIANIEHEAYHEKNDEKLTSLLNQASLMIAGVNNEIRRMMAITT